MKWLGEAFPEIIMMMMMLKKMMVMMALMVMVMKTMIIMLKMMMMMSCVEWLGEAFHNFHNFFSAAFPATAKLTLHCFSHFSIHFSLSHFHDTFSPHLSSQCKTYTALHFIFFRTFFISSFLYTFCTTLFFYSNICTCRGNFIQHFFYTIFISFFQPVQNLHYTSHFHFFPQIFHFMVWCTNQILIFTLL